MHNMGILKIEVEISPLDDPARRATLGDVMVDTGSELTWIPAKLLESLGIVPVKSMRFVTAEGTIVERDVGAGWVYAAGQSAPDYLVFARTTDMRLLGARTLEGMNLRVDLLARQLVPAGPMPAAVA